ncbi:MAG: DUF6095 family protein [Lutibacter sp.]
MKTAKQSLLKGLKYELVALPLLIISPILISIGFKAIKLQQNYIWLIFGIITGIAAIVVGFIGIKLIVSALFKMEE